MTEKEIIVHALTLWMNYITTGNMHLSKQDYINCGHDTSNLPKLDPEQLHHLGKLGAVREKALQGEYTK
jgi:hypothetical protein